MKSSTRHSSLVALCCTLLSTQSSSILAFTTPNAPSNRFATTSSVNGRPSLRHAPRTAPTLLRQRLSKPSSFALQATEPNGNDNTGADANDNAVIAQQLAQALQKDDMGQAIQILQANPAMQVNDQQWQAIFDALERTTAQAEENNIQQQQQQPEEPQTMPTAAEFPAYSRARNDLTQMYSTLQQRGQLSLFGAMAADRPLAAGSHVVPPALLERVTQMPMRALTPQSSGNGLWAGVAFMAVEILMSLATGWSLNVLFAATLALAAADRLLLNAAVSESIVQSLNPGVATKIARHEAGHLLVAYLLGCPVEGVVLSAWAALSDDRFGTKRTNVAAGTSFFDPQLSQQMNTAAGTTAAGGSGVATVTRSAVDRYSIVVMAGIAAEAIQYGQADGGAGDEMALIAFLSQLNLNQNRATGNKQQGTTTTTWDPEAIRNQARWGALQAVLMLRYYQPAYEALVDVLVNAKGGQPTLGECIGAIETAAEKHCLLPPSQPLGLITADANTLNPDEQAVWTPIVGTQSQSTVGNTWGMPAPTMSDATATTEAVETQAAVATAVATAAPEPPAVSEEEQLETLRGYRATVEERLRQVQERLDEIRDD